MIEVSLQPRTGVSLSDTARDRIRALIAEQGNEALMLRVYVEGGGCSGFQYGFSFDAEAGEDDLVVEQGGVKLLVDRMSMPYLTGSEIDYTEGLQGSQFVVNNPNAQATCGCGTSFSM